MKRNELWLVPILLLAGALSARGLNADLLFVDEYWSIFNSGGDPYGPLGPIGIWQRVAEVDPGGMGVGYYWLLGAWEWLVGSSPYAVRAFSLLVGLLAIAMTYRVGVALFSPRVGLYAAAIMGSSAFFINFMHEARAYTLFALATLLAVYIYWRITHDKDNPHLLWYAALTGAVALLAYTHYVALALPAALGVVHLLHFRQQQRWWLTLGAFCGGGLLFLPWLSIALGVINTGAADITRQSVSMDTPTILHELLQAFSNGSIGLLLLLGWFALRQTTRSYVLLLIWLLVGLGLVLLVNALIPFMLHLRYLMLLWPALALLVALGICRMARLGVPPTALLAIWLLVGITQSLTPTFAENRFGAIFRAPWAGLSQALDEVATQADADDALLFHIIPPGYEPFNFFVLDYLTETKGIAAHVDQFERMNNSFAGGDIDYAKDVAVSLDAAPTVWTLVLPQLETTQRSGVVDYTLRTQYARCGQQTLADGLELTRYVRLPDGPPQHSFSAAQTADGEINLTILAQDRSSVRVFWQPVGNIGRGIHSTAIHVEDADGHLVAQSDLPLPDERPFACSEFDLPLDHLPAGDYTRYLLVYAWQTLDRLPLSTDLTQERLRLDTITLE